MKESLKCRLRKDIERIREERSRTAPLADQPLRWEGCKDNPNGWRLLGDLADDLEEILNEIST